MGFAFEYHHGAMLLKYSGISFISGAVNHGFFSGERSLWTAAVGVILFVIGAVMEHRAADGPDKARHHLIRTLALGTLLSIGLGFFTGGLQHFPDSPARSAWVVPVGFVLSVFALAWSEAQLWRRSSAAYGVVASVLVTASSYGAWQWLERNPSFVQSHSHGDEHGAQATALKALRVDRVVNIAMDDQMRFTPDLLQVQAGQTVRLVVHNAGKMPHELVLGTDAEIVSHAAEMKRADSKGHDHGAMAALTVEPGQTGELVVQFSQGGTFQMACLIPGHYEAGMRGKVQVSMAAAGAASTPKDAHDHSKHRH